MQEQVIFLNIHDEPIGVVDKFEAHNKGALHRAVSVFIFNYNNELLIKRKSLDKYYTTGLWANIQAKRNKEIVSLS